MQRAYDQVVHDVALQKLNVVFCLDRGGLAGADGPTHHGAFDIAYFRCIPNMIVSAPMNEEELRNLMYTAQLPICGPFSIRYPRGEGVMTEWKTPFKEIAIGTGRKVRSGNDIAVLSIGHIGNLAAKGIDALLADGYSVAHYDMRFAKPIDEMLLHEVFGKFKHVITIEDGCIKGAWAAPCWSSWPTTVTSAQVKRLGIPDRWIEHGSQPELYAECGFDDKAPDRCGEGDAGGPEGIQGKEGKRVTQHGATQSQAQVHHYCWTQWGWEDHLRKKILDRRYGYSSLCEC
jgi:1-deoxy-D-xylulose-5-phosphate synthase